jgi:RecA/RadA recombinase
MFYPPQCITAASLAASNTAGLLSRQRTLRRPLETGLALIDSELGRAGLPSGSFLQLTGSQAAGKSLVSLQMVARALAENLDIERLILLLQHKRGRQRPRDDRGGISEETGDAVKKAAIEIRQEARTLMQRRGLSLGPCIAAPASSVSGLTHGAAPTSAVIHAAIITPRAPPRPNVGSKRARSAGAGSGSSRSKRSFPEWLIKGLVAAHPLLAQKTAASSSSSSSSSSSASLPVAASKAAKSKPMDVDGPKLSSSPTPPPPSFVVYLDFDHKLDVEGTLKPLLRRAIKQRLQSQQQEQKTKAHEGAAGTAAAAKLLAASSVVLEELCLKDCLSRLLIVRPTMVREGCSALQQLAAVNSTVAEAGAAARSTTASTRKEPGATSTASSSSIAKVAIYTGNGTLFDGPEGGDDDGGSTSTTASSSSLLSKLTKKLSGSGSIMLTIDFRLLVLDGHRSMAFDEASHLLPAYRANTGGGSSSAASADGGGAGAGPTSPEDATTASSAKHQHQQLSLQRLKDIAKAVENRLRPLYGDTSLSPLTGLFLSLLQQRAMAMAHGLQMPQASEIALKSCYSSYTNSDPSALSVFLGAQTGCSVVSVERFLPSDSYLREATTPSHYLQLPQQLLLPITCSSMSLDLILSGRRLGPLQSPMFRWGIHGYDPIAEAEKAVAEAKAAAQALPATGKAARAGAQMIRAQPSQVSPEGVLDGLLGDDDCSSYPEPPQTTSPTFTTTTTASTTLMGKGAALATLGAPERRKPERSTTAPCIWSVPGQPTTSSTSPSSSSSSSPSGPAMVQGASKPINKNVGGGYDPLNSAALVVVSPPSAAAPVAAGETPPAAAMAMAIDGDGKAGSAVAAGSMQHQQQSPLHIGLHMQRVGVIPVPLTEGGTRNTTTPAEVMERFLSSSSSSSTSPPPPLYANLTFTRGYVRKPFVFLVPGPPGSQSQGRSAMAGQVQGQGHVQASSSVPANAFPIVELAGLVNGKPSSSSSSSSPYSISGVGGAGAGAEAWSSDGRTATTAAPATTTFHPLVSELLAAFHRQSGAPSRPEFTRTAVPPVVSWLLATDGTI